MDSRDDITRAIRELITDLAVTGEADHVDQPHVAGVWDPEVAQTRDSIADAITVVTGPYPDQLSALEAAEKRAAYLNSKNGPDDPDWIPFALPLSPVTDEKAR